MKIFLFSFTREVKKAVFAGRKGKNLKILFVNQRRKEPNLFLLFFFSF